MLDATELDLTGKILRHRTRQRTQNDGVGTRRVEPPRGEIEITIGWYQLTASNFRHPKLVPKTPEPLYSFFFSKVHDRL